MRRSKIIQTRRNPRIFIPGPRDRQVVIPLPRLSLLIILSLSIFSGILAFRSDLFLVHEVLVQAKSQRSMLALAATEIKLAGDLVKSRALGKSIFFVDQKLLRQEILSHFYTFEEAAIQKSYPNRLLLILTPRIPVAEIDVWSATASAFLSSDEAGPEMGDLEQEPRLRFISDEKGYLFAQAASSSAIPVVKIFLNEEVKIGDRLEEKRIKTALAIIKELQIWQIKVREIGLVGLESIPVRLQDQTLVIFSSHKDVQAQVASLQAIITRHRMEKRGARQIDLRYTKPVVKY